MPRFKILSALVILATPIFLAAVAHADTYEFYRLGRDDFYETYGLDGSGAAVVHTFGSGFPCPTAPTPLNCYMTYVKGVLVSESPTPPALTSTLPSTPPPGPGCAGLPSFVTASDLAFNFCVNGYEFFGTGKPVEDPITRVSYNGVFTGPDLVADRLGGPPLVDTDGKLVAFSGAYVDQYGDLLWDSAFQGELIEAYNVTAHVPEPSTLSLLATGVLATIATIRKRRL